MPSEMSQSRDRYRVTALTRSVQHRQTCRRRKDSEGPQGCWRGGGGRARVGNRSFCSAGAQRSQRAATQPCARRSPYGIEPSGSHLGLVLSVLPQKTQTNKGQEAKGHKDASVWDGRTVAFLVVMGPRACASIRAPHAAAAETRAACVWLTRLQRCGKVKRWKRRQENLPGTRHPHSRGRPPAISWVKRPASGQPGVPGPGAAVFAVTGFIRLAAVWERVGASWGVTFHVGL